MAASTSTAADSNNNSCYDVFISHRGPDVKKTFASHLYRRLISYGLRVFLDYQELREGEDLTCQIKGAIRTASLHIAIFSPTYADSQWCLDELVLMLESTAPTIPVFHHVKPTELRRTHGEGAYARSLRNLERKRKYDSDQPRYGSETIEKWRNALSRVADISGLDLDAFNGDEGELLDKVVDAVFKKGVKTQLNVARHPTGLQEKVEDFETNVLSQQQSGKVQVVGITGCGGVGKTTLAKELFNRKNSNYIKSYFLLDIRENAKISLHSLQSKLLKGLLQLDKLEIENKDQGIEMLRKHLSSSQVLLVLDDIDDVEQVHALLPLDVLRHDSFILITSRDKNVLARSGVQESSIYKLTGLDTERSRELFCRHAFCQPHPLSGFEDLVNQFLRASDGLPLSLKVFGGLLYGNTDKSYWEDELDQLRKTLPSEIQKRLQISYDALQTEEKQIFLDIACFFIGESRNSAIRVWDGSGWKGSRGFQSLLNKCLVEVDINLKTMEHYIRMHDHLRDMGRDLANSSGFPCRLWRGTKHIEDLLQQSSEATKVRGIKLLRGYSGEDDDHVSSDDDDEPASFSRYKMKNLQLVDIDIEEEEDLWKCLLEGVDSPKLLWFRWRNCACSSLPPYIPMEKLRVIEVEGYRLETLWQEDSQAPLQLRELRIRVAQLFKIPKSIGQLKHLERMVVTSWWNSMIEIPKEFCDLRSLKHLVLRGTNMSSLPDSFGNLSMLEHINLSGCRALERLPDSFGNLSRLQHIDLFGCGHLERLPDSFGNLSMLEYIDLSRCNALERLPDSFENLSRLQHINLSGCGHLERLPDSFGNLSRLQHINLSDCGHLERLPDSFANLSRLQHIDLSGCRHLELPDSFGNLSMLEHIDLSRCSAVKRLPDSFGKLSRLQHIDLSGCGHLERLPDSFGNLIKLKYLNLSGCDKLTIPGGTFLKITLEDMTLPQWRMEVLPPQTVHQLSLKKVLLGLINLIEWPSAIGESSHVEKLVLETPFLETLPPSFGRDLRNLKYLELRRCRSLKRLPDSFLLLNQLIELTVEDCCLPELHLKAGEGESKTLTDSGGQRTLNNSESCLHRLQYLKMHKTQISEISFSTSVCPRLQHLEIRECRDLVEVGTLPDALQHLELHSSSISEVSFPTGVCPNLQHLEIRECRDLVEVGTLPDALIDLQLTGCPNLSKIERLCGFPKLQTLDGSLCKEGEELPLMEDKSRALTEWRGQRALSDLDSSFDKYLLRLQHLELYITSISEVSFPTGVCPNLQRLDIRECRDLVEVGTLPDALINLQLTGCPKLSKIERLCGFPKLQTLDGSLCKEVEELPLMEDKSGALTEWRGQRALSDLDSSFDKYLLTLQHLELHSTAISEVSFPTGVCPNLQRLHIRECRDLVEVGTLPDALINLQLTGCPKLRKIERLCGFPKFQTLDVSLCKEDERGTLTESRGKRALGNLDFSFDKYLLRLQHLELHDIAISEVSFPTGVCPNLQHLDITECRDLVDVGTLPDALINLQLAGCPQLKKIERLFAFTEQQTLYRRVHRTFSNLDPLFDKSMLSLQHLEPCNTEISEVSFPKGVYPNLQGKKETLTESIGQRTFNNLDPLFDKSMLSLQHLGPCNTEISEVSFPKGVYPNLQYLSIKHGESTVEFGKSPNGEFMKLEVLNCCKLRKIEELCGLAKLQILDISSCEGVELSSMETLVSLENLQVLGCHNLKSMHGLAHLTHLRELNVSGCSELEELPGLDHLTSLETLLAGECVKLEGIQGLARLTQLRELSVSGCSELQELPGLEHLTSLKKLSANKCVNLKNIKGLEQLTQLRELSISGCSKLQELPGLDHLTSLEMLLAGECAKLESIQGLARLTQLRELSVSGCSQLQELPGLEHLTSLKKLSADKLKNIKGLEQLTQLLEVDVSGCFELEEMPGVECLQPSVELRL